MKFDLLIDNRDTSAIRFEQTLRSVAPPAEGELQKVEVREWRRVDHNVRSSKSAQERQMGNCLLPRKIAGHGS